jgi:NitT/TauT family transport system ATP-binding protein
MSARPGRIVETRRIDIARPRDLAVCYEPHFVDTVHELRNQIATVRRQ